MEEGLTKIDSRGGTAMRDAVNAAIDYVKKKGKHDKKVLFVITDGNDTASTQITLEKLVQKAHDTEVLLYFIGLLNEEDKREAKKAKTRDGSAGARRPEAQRCSPRRSEEVEKSPSHGAGNPEPVHHHVLADESVARWKLPHDQGNREWAGPSVVRTRTGYYATPDASPRNPLL